MAAEATMRSPASRRPGKQSPDFAMNDDKAESQALLGAKDLEPSGAMEAQVLSMDDKAHPGRRIMGLPVSVFAGSLYCCASLSMVLLNKMALSSFSFKSVNALLLFQCLVCVVAVQVFQVLQLIKVERFNLNIVKLWLPVNLIFVGMIGTSFWALQSLNVAMVTVLKNLTNIFTIAGDYYFYGRTYNRGVLACMGLMVLSALCGAYTDLAFDLRGYLWQMVNCAFTAAYSLYLRGAMDRVAQHTSSGKRLDEFSMVFFNNLLSLPFILALMAGNGEVTGVWAEPDLHNPMFLLVASLSGLIGFGISFTSLWFISTTTPTIYSLVGSLNKVPLAFIGLFAFNTPWSIQNLASIAVGLFAGVVFVLAKSK